MKYMSSHDQEEIKKLIEQRDSASLDDLDMFKIEIIRFLRLIIIVGKTVSRTEKPIAKDNFNE